MDENQQLRFEAWHKRKQIIVDRETYRQIFFREKDVWWCSLGLNIGTESYGKGDWFRRPVLILKKLSNDLCICPPITSKRRIGSWFASIMINGIEKWVMLCQIKTLHRKRFGIKIGFISDSDFTKVKEKLESLLELSVKSSPGHFALDQE
ncbi:TPA: hypothetical protein DEP96_00430 [Candidatus Uhrbacteria bacterium]|nr:hypothetical protein [Candidatus Uhrbacteria bacterium]